MRLPALVLAIIACLALASTPVSSETESSPLPSPQEWTTFSPPDGTYSVSVPLLPAALPGNSGQLWTCAVKSQFALMFGWAPVDEISEDPATLGPILKAYADTYMASSQITEKSRKSLQVGGHSALDVTGVKDDVPVRSLLFLSAADHRGYALVAFGQVDVERFFSSFKLLKSGGEGKG